MTPLQAVVLGALQGITEFLPISSSGHLIVVPALFGWEVQGMVFDITVHLATLCAIMIALRHEMLSVIRGVRKNVRADRALVTKLLLATIPAVIAGVLLGGEIESVRTVTIVAWMLIVWGVLLFVADYVPRKRTVDARRVYEVGWGQAIVVGLAQAFALVPGTSRSGATMTFGLFSGMDRGQAARFSFMLAVPAILGAGAKTAFDAAQAGGIDIAWPVLGIGFVSALVCGVLAIRFLFFIIRKSGFGIFAAYRIVLGITLLILAARGVIAS